MRVLSATLRDFRNVAHAHISFSPSLTVLVGANGQGKTNVLEALFFASALRPLRSVPRAALVRAGARRAHVDLRVERAATGLETRLEVELGASARGLRADDKRVDAGAFVGRLVTVAFTPDDLTLTKGSPDERRRFLDRAIFQASPGYLGVALRYHRALKARNKLLVEGAEASLLEAYEVVLAREGARIWGARDRYVRQLGPEAERAFARIARPGPELRLSLASPRPEGETEAGLCAWLGGALAAARATDRRRRRTTVGPHTDDLDVRLDGEPARTRASQGQHRALVLGLKLAEVALSTQALGEPPVLLLDDISSELDAERTAQLFEALFAIDAQVVLTTTELRLVPEAGAPRALYRVEAGALERFVA